MEVTEDVIQRFSVSYTDTMNVFLKRMIHKSEYNITLFLKTITKLLESWNRK